MMEVFVLEKVIHMDDRNFGTTQETIGVYSTKENAMWMADYYKETQFYQKNEIGNDNEYIITQRTPDKNKNLVIVKYEAKELPSAYTERKTKLLQELKNIGVDFFSLKHYMEEQDYELFQDFLLKENKEDAEREKLTERMIILQYLCDYTPYKRLIQQFKRRGLQNFYKEAEKKALLSHPLPNVMPWLLKESKKLKDKDI